MRKIFFIVTLSVIVSISLLAQPVEEISPQKAYQMVKDPSTYLIDGRSIAEYVFVGHPEMAYNVPLLFWSEKEHKLIPNDAFIQDIKKRFTQEDILIFICRSGKRSLKAANLAFKAGFRHVFSIKEGFEGNKDEKGYRIVDGWKNRRLPYTYQLKKELIYKPQK